MRVMFLLRVTCRGQVAIDDGLLSLTVEEIKGTDVVCRVNNTVMLGETKGINLPVSLLPPPPLSPLPLSRLPFPRVLLSRACHFFLSVC